MGDSWGPGLSMKDFIILMMEVMKWLLHHVCLPVKSYCCITAGLDVILLLFYLMFILLYLSCVLKSHWYVMDQKLDWADMLYLYTQPLESRNTKFWPDQPANFRYDCDCDSSSPVAVLLLLST